MNGSLSMGSSVASAGAQFNGAKAGAPAFHEAFWRAAGPKE
jgi:hypothetical protein